MNSLSCTSSLSYPSTYQQYGLHNRLPRLNTNNLCQYSNSKCCYVRHSDGNTSVSYLPLTARSSLACAKNLPEEGLVAVADFEDLDDKDWSFLGVDSMKSKEEHDRKVDQIIYSGNVVGTSKILISMGSDDFVDRLVESSPSQLLLLVHESFLSLACIKERHDKVKCWQGEFSSVPKKWAPFDVVFLYYLPAFPHQLEETFKALASFCATGARVVISHLQGRQGLEQERQKYPNNVVSELPEKLTLENVASNHSFMMKEYIDDPSFYLAVLEFNA
ncbi:uncharacterized protein LOC141657431 isoform X2 [Silene latifolia]|uniref:uncharacterized protein LOC141657431 isoform X2 n=1 Tax=Silene latifolia TaxID=37657 RepID=UPI003D774D4F